MKLTDLQPRWFALEHDGPHVGLTFLCPHCQNTFLAVAFHHHGHEAMEDAYIRAHYANDPSKYIWDLQGQEDFATLTLSPSIDCSKSGHWHGFITNGEIR